MFKKEIIIVITLTLFLHCTNSKKELFDAIKEHNIQKTNELIDKGASVESRDEHGFTPLMWAVWMVRKYHNYDYSMVKLLLSKGANPNAIATNPPETKGMGFVKGFEMRTRYPHTYIIYSTTDKEFFPLLNILVQAGLDLNMKIGSDNRPIISTCVIIGDYTIIKNLLQLGANPEVLDIEGKSALYWAKVQLNKQFKKINTALDGPELRKRITEYKQIIELLTNYQSNRSTYIQEREPPPDQREEEIKVENGRVVDPEGKDSNKLLLTIILTDSLVTIGAKSGFLPSLFYIEIDGNLMTCDENYKNIYKCLYTKSGKMVTNANGIEISKVNIGDTVYTVENPRKVIFVTDIDEFELKPLSVLDELKNRLLKVKKRFKDADDADDVILAAENQVRYEKVVKVMEVAKSAGFPNVKSAKIKDESLGYDAGHESGFGGGTKAVDKLVSSLMGRDTGGSGSKKRGTIRIATPKFTKGGRSKSSIMRVVMHKLAALRYTYNKRLREKPGLKGRITVKFAIDEFGKVIFCQVVSSTMGDPTLEKIVVSKIKRWVFEKIDKPGDVTEIVYPFVFSQ